MRRNTHPQAMNQQWRMEPSAIKRQHSASFLISRHPLTFPIDKRLRLHILSDVRDQGIRRRFCLMQRLPITPRKEKMQECGKDVPGRLIKQLSTKFASSTGPSLIPSHSVTSGTALAKVSASARTPSPSITTICSAITRLLRATGTSGVEGGSKDHRQEFRAMAKPANRDDLPWGGERDPMPLPAAD